MDRFYPVVMKKIFVAMAVATVYHWYGGHEGHCVGRVMKKILRRISLILA